MKPVLVPGRSNVRFAVADEPPDEAVPAERTAEAVITHWAFEHPDELAAVAAGAKLELVIAGTTLPPVTLDVTPPVCEIHSVEKEALPVDGLLGVEFRCPMCDTKEPAAPPTDSGPTNVSIWAITQEENPEETDVRAVTCRACRWATFATDGPDADRRAADHLRSDRHKAAVAAAARTEGAPS